MFRDLHNSETNSTLLNLHLRKKQRVRAALVHPHWLCIIRVYFVKCKNACFCNPTIRPLACSQMLYEQL